MAPVVFRIVRVLVAEQARRNWRRPVGNFRPAVVGRRAEGEAVGGVGRRDLDGGHRRPRSERRVVEERVGRKCWRQTGLVFKTLSLEQFLEKMVLIISTQNKLVRFILASLLFQEWP